MKGWMRVTMVSCDGGVMDGGACSMDEVAWDALDVDVVVASRLWMAALSLLSVIRVTALDYCLCLLRLCRYCLQYLFHRGCFCRSVHLMIAMSHLVDRFHQQELCRQRSLYHQWRNLHPDSFSVETHRQHHRNVDQTVAVSAAASWQLWHPLRPSLELEMRWMLFGPGLVAAIALPL